MQVSASAALTASWDVFAGQGIQRIQACPEAVEGSPYHRALLVRTQLLSNVLDQPIAIRRIGHRPIDTVIACDRLVRRWVNSIGEFFDHASARGHYVRQVLRVATERQSWAATNLPNASGAYLASALLI